MTQKLNTDNGLQGRWTRTTGYNRGQLRNLAVSALGSNLVPPNDSTNMKDSAIKAKLRKPSIR